jgi:mannonate dehydratase
MRTPVTIRDIRVVTCRPTTENLVIVIVDTSEPGLFGLGDATFTQRYLPVVSAIENYLKPLLIGRDVSQINELWRLMHHNGYWRAGPVLNNAISGIDMALWDIKGKRAGMPVYELIGGKVRPAAAVYRHACGEDVPSVLASVRRFVEAGVRHVRVQLAPRADVLPSGQLQAGGAGYGGTGFIGARPEGSLPGVYLDPVRYADEIDETLAAVRIEFGQSIEIVHDVHSRLLPSDVIRLARRLERHRLFFLEDALPPEQLHWLPALRAATTTPLAIGELFIAPHEWVGPVERHELDFLRMHLSSIGGFTPAVVATHHAQMHDVRTAWHCPKDIAPIGVAANLAIDVSAPNFGIQEFADFTAPEMEIFSGLPEVRHGYLYPSERPGWGIELNEEAAQRFPAKADVIEWTQVRGPDGSLLRP